MRNILIVLIGLFVLNTTAQISFVGFSSPNCSQPMTNVYTFTNTSSGSGSGSWHSMTIYRNGTPVYNNGGQASNGMLGHELIFINDSTGFFAYRLFSGGTQLIKTNDYGVTWSLVGSGAPNYLGFYIVNSNYAYLVTTYNNFVQVTKCSDVQQSQSNFILDYNINSDIYKVDTVLNNSLCNIDSLNIFIKNGLDTITYHINKSFPIYGLPINPFPQGCLGHNINVAFDIGTTFNSGNVFTAELSDAFGSFASPITIGSLASVSAGTISAVIPLTVALGSGYKIRVVSSSPVFYGTDNGAKISIINNLPTLNVTGNINGSSTQTISLAGPNTMCSGQYASLTVSGAETYTWSDGSNSQYFFAMPTVTTTYSVIGENACGTASNSITIGIVPQPVISVSGASFCPGVNSLTLTASGGLTYTWSPSPGTFLVGSSLVLNSNINVNYHYFVEGSNGYCSTTAQGNLVAQTIPTITVTGTNSLCIGAGTMLEALGALTYTWNNGVTTSSISVSPSVTTTYSVSGENICGIASETATVFVENASPTLTISGSNSVCIGSGVNFIGSGATTYTWSTGSTSQYLNDIPVGNTSYTLLGENVCGVSTETVNVIVDPSCQDVWPGDSNSDGIANNLDILELGLHYTQMGPQRATINNAWQPYFSNNWTGNITNGKNLNHSDCNGDGVVNSDDTLAIYNNYGFTHVFKPADVSSSAQITIWADQSSVHKNSWGSASIYLGDVSHPVNNVNGLAMTLNFENSYLETDSVYIEYISSFLNLSHQNLNFKKIDFSNGKIYTATTHTIPANANGFGKIAVIHFKINPHLTQDEYLHFGLSNVYKSDSAGIISNVNIAWPSSSETIALATFAVTEVNNNSFLVVPNPTNGLVTITSNELMQKVEVKNTTNQILLSEIMNDKTYQLQLQNFANGIYFVKVYYLDGISIIKKVIVNH